MPFSLIVFLYKSEIHVIYFSRSLHSRVESTYPYKKTRYAVTVGLLSGTILHLEFPSITLAAAIGLRQQGQKMFS